MEKIHTIGELREAIKNFNDSDSLVIEIHEGVRHEDLYAPTLDVIQNVAVIDGTFISEIRLCI